MHDFLTTLNELLVGRDASLKERAAFWQAQFAALDSGDPTTAEWAQIDAFLELRRASEASIADNDAMREVIRAAYHIQLGRTPND